MTAIVLNLTTQLARSTGSAKRAIRDVWWMGKHRTVNPAEEGHSHPHTLNQKEPKMIGFETFPRKIQLTDYTCGPCSVWSIIKKYSDDIDYQSVKVGVKCDEDGTYPDDVVKYLRKQNMRVCVMEQMDLDDLICSLALGYCVMSSFDKDHFAVIYGYDERSDEFLISDPSLIRWPIRRIPYKNFMNRWDRDGLLVRPREVRDAN
jgi:predicted double-glycine peptidase